MVKRSKLKHDNGFKPLHELRMAAKDERVDEIEGHGMDDGRVFIHLLPEYKFPDGSSLKSVGNVKELTAVMLSIDRRK